MGQMQIAVKWMAVAMLTIISKCRGKDTHTVIECALKHGATELVSYLEMTGLNETLSTGGPYTLLAPKNSAFHNLPGHVKDLLAEKEALKNLLLYHVIHGNETLSEMKDDELKQSMAEDHPKIRINRYMGDWPSKLLMAGGSEILSDDEKCGNGIVFVMAQVMLPPSGTVIDIILENDEQFSSLFSAVQAAEWTSTLSGSGPYTVFAPTNEAFEAFGQGKLKKLLKDPIKIKEVLKDHVVADTLYSGSFAYNEELNTLAEQDIIVKKVDGILYVNGVELIQKDITATNGVIQVINNVILTEKRSSSQSQRCSISQVAFCLVILVQIFTI